MLDNEEGQLNMKISPGGGPNPAPPDLPPHTPAQPCLLMSTWTACSANQNHLIQIIPTVWNRKGWVVEGRDRGWARPTQTVVLCVCLQVWTHLQHSNFSPECHSRECPLPAREPRPRTRPHCLTHEPSTTLVCHGGGVGTHA